MEMELISRENVKPSSPTPPNLKTHNLSLLDLIQPPMYVPILVYFHHNTNTNTNTADEFIARTTQTLKRSLSSTLTLYYPLAGTLAKDSRSVDCNDEGVPFVVSRIKCTLSEFLKKPAEHRLCNPHDRSWTFVGPGANVALIQVNCFDCGGIEIGSIFLHTVTDGVTIGTFIKAWAASARGGSEAAELDTPSYTAASVFPANEAMKKEPNMGSAITKYWKMGEIVRKPYVFNSSAISTIREKLMSSSSSPGGGGGGGLEFRPSRVQIVSALIWKCFIAATLSTTASNRRPISVTTQAVNLRRKADPPIPEHSFGNYVWLALASSVNQTDVDLKDLILKMRDSVRKIDSHLVRRMEGGEGFPGYLQNLQEMLKEFHENAEFFMYSSWCNFGLYDIDFGFGSPVWVTGCDGNHEEKHTPILNSVLLMDTKDRGGIEAWVSIDEHYFEAFDSAEELKALAGVAESISIPVVT